MDVRDELLPEEQYAAFIEHMPEVCVELVVERDGEVLLARRENEPASGEWFWPGSRLYKGEETDAAAHRVAAEELDIEVELDGLVGVYSHFWERSAQSEDVSRHTVNVVYRATPTDPDPDVTLDEQHGDYRWLAERNSDLHEYVLQYLDDAGLPAP